MIGDATGRAKQATQLIDLTKNSLDRVRTETAHAPAQTVVLVVSRTPGSLSDMYVATEGSYLIDLLTIAGARSVVKPAPAGYVNLSKEALLSLNPDVIIDLQHTAGSAMGEHAGEVWNDLPELKAVHDKHVYELTDPMIVHPSQFVAHTAEVFERILHPELLTKRAH
jgi:ABC-type Fe3+-hydroxamate transport system substrate-binding protein